MKKRKCEYGTMAQGSIEEKTLLTVPCTRYVAINKTEMDAVLSKFRELGVRTTEEKIASCIFKHLREIAAENNRLEFTNEDVHAIWNRYRKAVLKLSPQKIMELAGFDPRILSKPSRQSRK